MGGRAVRPRPMATGAKAFAAVGCARTVSEPDALGAVPAFVVVIAPVLFTYEPAAALVTLTVTVHAPFAGTVAAARSTPLPPLAAVTVAPAHVVAPEADAVFTRPAGYASLN